MFLHVWNKFMSDKRLIHTSLDLGVSVAPQVYLRTILRKWRGTKVKNPPKIQNWCTTEVQEGPMPSVHKSCCFYAFLCLLNDTEILWSTPWNSWCQTAIQKLELSLQFRHCKFIDSPTSSAEILFRWWGPMSCTNISAVALDGSAGRLSYRFTATLFISVYLSVLTR